MENNNTITEKNNEKILYSNPNQSSSYNNITVKTPYTWWWVLIMSIIVVGFGVLFHYTYEWSKENPYVGTFSAINESVWEHLKLLFYPLIIAALIQYIFIRHGNLGAGIFFGAVTGIFLIMALFYIYVGAFTHPNTYVGIDISIFIISSIIAVIVATWIFSLYSFGVEYNFLSTIGIFLLLFMFITFTFITPDLPLFIPPNEE